MTSLEFDTNVVYDRGTPQTVEESFRAYANWSGIHKFKFDNQFELASFDVEGDSGWTYTSLASPVSHSLLLRYNITLRGHGAIFGLQGDNGWIAGVTEANNGEIYQLVSGVQTLVFRTPLSCPNKGKVEWAFREIRMSDAKDDIWVCISLWVNECLQFTRAFYTGAVLIGDVALGLATSRGDQSSFADIEIPLLTDFTEWCSLDPGESPMGGLNRSIEGRYVKFYLRHSGELRAWTSQPTPSVFEYVDQNLLERIVETFDRRDLFTYIRMMGAYEQAEFHAPELSRIYGFRFAEVNNPYLMSPDECRTQAEREILRRQENAFRADYTHSFRPLLEPEDHITVLDNERIISSISWEFGPAQTVQQTNTRKYTYGS